MDTFRRRVSLVVQRRVRRCVSVMDELGLWSSNTNQFSYFILKAPHDGQVHWISNDILMIKIQLFNTFKEGFKTPGDRHIREHVQLMF